MKFIQKLLGCCKEKKESLKKMKDQLVVSKNLFSKGRKNMNDNSIVTFERNSVQNPGIPKWVEMKCNSLVYLKQIMKQNRKKKMQQYKEDENEKDNEEDKEQTEGLKKKSTDIAKTAENKPEEIKGKYINTFPNIKIPIIKLILLGQINDLLNLENFYPDISI
mgnify:CR=1 FL=1